ncbi:MAG: HAMP domain-containing protein, partial [Candidatus Latescibacteria bacterium]|nr:HAMP domain-containing protein [Candidatus Latescibacterota bacterium]
MSRKIGLVAAAVLGVSLTLMVVVLMASERQRELDQARAQVGELDAATTAALKFAMAQGTENVAPLLKQMGQIGDTRELRLMPTALVRKGGEGKMDPVEQEVARTRQRQTVIEEFGGEPVIRLVDPVLAEPACLECHDSARAGEVLAVFSLRASMAEANAAIAQQQWHAGLLALVTIVLAVVVLLVVVERKVGRVLQRCVELARQLAAGDLRGRLELQTHDETGQLARSFMDLRASLENKAQVAEQIAQGNLAVVVRPASAEDTLGQAMEKMVDSLKRMQAQVEVLSQAAVEGKLSTRGDASKYQGAYRDIVQGVNETLDSVIGPLNVAAD